MTELLIILMLVLVGLGLLPFVLSLVHAGQINRLRKEVARLADRLSALEPPTAAQASRAPEPVPVQQWRPPPVPASSQQVASTTPGGPPVSSKPAAPIVPPAPVIPTPAPQPTAPSRAPAPASGNLEAVMGVKFFAWVGGFAFFLGVVFCVKYAFDNNLVTPAMRVWGGAIVGLLLVATGWLSGRRQYRAPAQSLCASGILVLYAVAYAAHGFYSLISLGAAFLLMSGITAGAFVLAVSLDAQVVVALGLLGGFVTPVVLSTGQDNPRALFGYIALLCLGVGAVAIRKRWDYLVLLAAIGTVVTEFAWALSLPEGRGSDISRVVFLGFQALFLALVVVRQRFSPSENWTTSAAALAGFAVLIFCCGQATSPDRVFSGASRLFPLLFAADVGLLALAVLRSLASNAGQPRHWIVAITLALTALAEWLQHEHLFATGEAPLLLAWYAVVLCLFAAYPYFVSGTSGLPWALGAIAGPVQFWIVYATVASVYPNNWMGLLPAIFAVIPAAGVWFLVRYRNLPLAAGDFRVAIQAAAAVGFISLISPIQFSDEWITLGWAIEGVALLYLFRVIPNQTLRVGAFVVLSGAFLRLAFNPYVFSYHERSPVRIWNWYLYTYGIATVCMVRAAPIFPTAQDSWINRSAPRLFYTFSVILLFLLMNIEIADYFSVGPTLTFLFNGNFARDMTYSISWALFAFGLLVVGIIKNVRAVRLSAIALLCFTFAKLFLHDLDNLNQLYRIAAFLSVALIAIVASFTYQRFLLPARVSPVDKA